MSWVAALAIVAGVYLVANLVVRRFGLGGSSLDRESLRELVQRNDDAVCLIDVRSAAEYESGHIPTALNIPHTSIGSNPPRVSKDALIVLYCQTGSRSQVARATLTRKGYTNLVNFGSLRRWRAPIVTGGEPGRLLPAEESIPDK